MSRRPVVLVSAARPRAGLAALRRVSGPDRPTAPANPTHALAAATIAETVRAGASEAPEHGLRMLVELAIRSGPWNAGGITAVARNGVPRAVTHVGERALACGAAQHDLGEGPGIDALATGAAQVGADLVACPRWPRWSAVALAAGVQAALSVRLYTAETIGTLDLHAARPAAVDPVAARNAELVAAHASVLLSALTTRLNLEKAISTRTLIGQAQGVLMHRYGLTPRGAFDLLRRISQQRNIRIAVLAESLVTGGTVPDLEIGEPTGALTVGPARYRGPR